MGAAGVSTGKRDRGPGDSVSAVQPVKSRRWLWGLAIAVCFASWALRTVGSYNTIETDAARHAMNGVFLRDLIARGRFTDVMEFARTYYAHLPALSLPYHPPLFPLIEAGFYSIFGVSVLSARLAVALAIGVCALILFLLVLKTSESATLAAVSTITFLCLPEALWLGSDVMLEFPALVFTLLAIYCLHPVDREYPMRRALCFAVFAGAAVWTKQLTVFLGAVPILYLMLLGRWRLFLRPAIWVSTGVFAGIVAALTALSLPVHGAGVTQAIPAAPIPIYQAYYRLLVRNADFYARHYYDTTGPVGIILVVTLGIALIVGVFRRGRPPSFRAETALYLAWAMASLGVLFLLRPYATRYLFFTYPALIVLGYAGLLRVAGYLRAGRRAASAAAIAVAALAVVQFPHRTHFLHGPDEAARELAAVHPRRILYCGGTDGNFILNYRLARAGLDTAIITGDKLPAATFAPVRFEQFAHDYGVQYIVLEDAEEVKSPWEQLSKAGLSTMILERQIQLISSTIRWNGSLRIYRFTNPSPEPKDDLAMRMFMIGGTMDFNLAR